jgi:putative endonuclease
MGSSPIRATGKRLHESGAFFMLYTVYIFFSEPHDRIYVRFSSHLINRFHSHNYYNKRLNKKLSSWFVIYLKYYEEKRLEMKREKQLKSAAAREQIRIKIARDVKRNCGCLNRKVLIYKG